MKIILRITETANVILVMLFLSLKCHVKLLPVSLQLLCLETQLKTQTCKTG